MKCNSRVLLNDQCTQNPTGGTVIAIHGEDITVQWDGADNKPAVRKVHKVTELTTFTAPVPAQRVRR